MRKFRLRYFVISAITLAFISGLLFYRQVLKDYRKGPRLTKLQIEEILHNRQIYITSLYELKFNLNTNADEVIASKDRYLDSSELFIKQSNQVNQSQILKIKNAIEFEIEKANDYIKTLRKLEIDLKDLNPAYNELQKNNFKYTLDGKDLYRECILDAYNYTLSPSKDVTWKLEEDIKILNQLNSFTKTPMPILENYIKKLEHIKKNNDSIKQILTEIKQNNIENMLYNLYKEESKTTDFDLFRERGIMILFAVSFLLYLFCIFILIKKL